MIGMAIEWQQFIRRVSIQDRVFGYITMQKI